VQCGQFAFVCIYICAYPSHFNCVGVVSVVLSPDYEPRGDRDVIVRESKWSRLGPHGIGLTRRRSTCEKDCARAEMEQVSGLSVIVLQSKNRNKGTLHQKRVRQRRKSLTD